MAERTAKERWLPWLLFLFLWASFGYFYHTGQHNEEARFDQIRMVVENHQWRIDTLAGNTGDLIVVNGHYYPNKAPGTTYLGVLPWWIFHSVLSATPLSVAAQRAAANYLTVLSTLGLFSALAGTALFVFLRRLLPSPAAALFFAILYSLGTIAFPFSTVFFSHQLVASFLFLAFFLLWRQRSETVPSVLGKARRTWELVLAGFLLGFAPVLEYPAALGTIVIGFYGLTNIGLRRFPLFLAAGLLGGSPLLIYNWTAFHQVFFITYDTYTADSAFSAQSRGIAGVSWPRWSIFAQITFVRQRGLFYANPWLVLIFPAFLTLREAAWRRELFACFGLVVAFFTFNSGFGDSIVYWGGAVSIGPRHLIPMLPFMAIPIALLCRRRTFAVAAIVLGGFSLLAMFLATAITPHVPYDPADPFFGFYFRQLFLGRFTQNECGILAGQLVPGLSFNLGRLIHLPPRTEALPLALVWAVALPFLFWAGGLFKGIGPSGWSRFRKAAPFCFSAALVALALAPVVWDPYETEQSGWSHGVRGQLAPGRFAESTTAANGDADFLRPEKVLPRHDAVIDFDWQYGDRPLPAPCAGIWRGALYIPVSGGYVFALESDEGSAFYLNSRPVIDHWPGNSPERKRTTVFLPRGFYRLAIHYENLVHSGRLRFFWAPPGAPLEIVPTEYLFSQ